MNDVSNAQGNFVKSAFGRNCIIKFIAYPARRFFRRKTPASLESLYILLFEVARQIEFFSQSGHKLGIPVGLLPPQAVVQVSDGQLEGIVSGNGI